MDQVSVFRKGIPLGEIYKKKGAWLFFWGKSKDVKMCQIGDFVHCPLNMKVDTVQDVIKTLYTNLYIFPFAMLFIKERGQYTD